MAVTLLQGSKQPVSIAAAKSALGHAEAGAGVMGVLRTVWRLCSGEAQALTHLRTVNPHVASILETSKCPVSLPRQSGPGQSFGDLHMGISSFAFQVCMAWCIHTCHKSGRLILGTH